MSRTEHPNPQFKRASFTGLNGEWQFEIAAEDANAYRAVSGRELSGRINVPFCPESELSGIAVKEPIKACWYKRTFFLERGADGQRLTVNFGAVDYSAKVYINGSYAGIHSGGYTPFSIEISKLVKPGENEIAVFVRDDVSANVPSGKQTPKKDSFGCFYSRVTGIWQSVYLETTPKDYIKSVRFFPNIENSSVDIEIITEGAQDFKAEIFFDGRPVGKKSAHVSCKKTVHCKLTEKHLWDIGKGNLYDVELRFGEDRVQSYFGLREVRYEGLKFLLNGRSVFQRLVLDQGYYRSGLYTAENERDYAGDIERAMELGFNGARLHQKVFEPRYLYHCDRMGFMVWGEYASWGVNYTNMEAAGVFLNEWREAVERDFNHPCVVLWSPLNETWEDLEDERKVRDLKFVEAVYDFTKTLDSTRPCVDVSGGYHGRRTDLFDFHSYGTYPELKGQIEKLENEGVIETPKMYAPGEEILYSGQPVSLSEFGGVTFGASCVGVTRSNCVMETTAWGYETAESEPGFVQNYAETVKLLLGCRVLSGFCYTQLYDIEQEQNGLYYYDRSPKFSEESIRLIRESNMTVAAIEDGFTADAKSIGEIEEILTGAAERENVTA